MLSGVSVTIVEPPFPFLVGTTFLALTTFLLDFLFTGDSNLITGDSVVGTCAESAFNLDSAVVTTLRILLGKLFLSSG